MRKLINSCAFLSLQGGGLLAQQVHATCMGSSRRAQLVVIAVLPH